MSSRIIINGQSFTSNSGNIAVSNNKIVMLSVILEEMLKTVSGNIKYRKNLKDE